MNRNVLLVVGGFVLLAVGVTGGTALLAAAVPPPAPLPTMAPITPPQPGADAEPAPAPTVPTFDLPGPRWADVLQDEDVLVTADQLAEYARANEWRIGADYSEWVAVNALVIDCMADAGFWFDPRVFRLPNGEPPPEGFGLALDGNTGAGDAYRWQDAGCWGAATHVLGTTS